MEIIVGHSILDQYFDETTMSVHFKANRPVLKKKGEPGAWKPSIDKDLVLNKKELTELIEKIFKELEAREDGFLEIDKILSKIIQLGPYRIVIVHPPLSDGLEMTIVKPIKILTIADYNLDSEIMDLLKNKAKGILISGAPGSGKTTFAQALVGLYHESNYIIKTVESPRDLLVSDDVVQYSFTYGSHDDLRDILLLSRPDYTIYDEVRNKPDFELYKDLRLTGIGLVGVIHATRPVDSIQRFLGSIEMGIIPQVIDTVIYIDAGKIEEILQLKLTVKVPEGMMSADLARPVIQVSSYLTKEVKYEIYSFGEQIVVMPMYEIKEATESKLTEYAQDAVQQKLNTLLSCPFLAKVKGANDVNLYVPAKSKPSVIGRGGQVIMETEKKLGLKLHVSTFDDMPTLDVETKIQHSTKKQKMSIQFPAEMKEKRVTLLSNGELFSFFVGTDAKIYIKKARIADSLENSGFLVIDTAQL